MHLRLFALVVLLILSGASAAFAQQDLEDDRFEGVVSGIVKDGETDEVLRFARVDLYHESDSSMVMTALSHDDGSFELDGLRAGLYFLEIHYADYEPKSVVGLVIADARKKINVGEILLRPASSQKER